MNKKILYFGTAFVITALAAINVNVNSQKRGLSDPSLANVEALARNEINEDCPNGCLDNGSGCWCYQWYPCYQEYVW